VLLGHSFGGYFAACYTMKSLGELTWGDPQSFSALETSCGRFDGYLWFYKLVFIDGYIANNGINYR